MTSDLEKPALRRSVVMIAESTVQLLALISSVASDVGGKIVLMHEFARGSPGAKRRRGASSPGTRQGIFAMSANRGLGLWITPCPPGESHRPVQRPLGSPVRCSQNHSHSGYTFAAQHA